MRKYFKLILSFALAVSSLANAYDPMFYTIKQINFGELMFSTGGCQMDPDTSELTAFNGQFLCIYPINVSRGEYIIRCDPNKTVRMWIFPNLTHHTGYTFNPKIIAVGQNETKTIYNESNYVDINSGDFGQINLYMGGELTISTAPPPSTTIEFSFENAIQWEVIE